MSQQVTVDYQGVSIQVQAKCDTAVHSLCQIDKVLDRIHNLLCQAMKLTPEQEVAILNKEYEKI